MAKKASKKKTAKKPAKKAAKKTTKKKPAAKKPAKKKPAKKASAKKKTAKKPTKKAAKKPAKKKPAKKKSAAKKSATKKSTTKKKSAARKKPAKKATKKPAKKSAKKKSAAKKSAGKKKPAAKKSTTSKKTSGKSGKKKTAAKTTRKKSTMAKKSSGSKKAGVKRTAKKISNKGVLIKLKRDKEETPEGKPRREVKAVEKSRGENPVNLHHRKPTKKEADEFRQLLVVRRAQLQGDVTELQNEAFSDETQQVSTNHLADGAFEQYEQEFALSMIENETEELKEIARAIEKIDRGEYGVCESCGIDISIERLRVMPYTRICIHCREEFEERGGGEEYGVHPERRV